MALGEGTDGPKRHSTRAMYRIKYNDKTAWNAIDMDLYHRYVSDHEEKSRPEHFEVHLRFICDFYFCELSRNTFTIDATIVIEIAAN